MRILSEHTGIAVNKIAKQTDSCILGGIHVIKQFNLAIIGGPAGMAAALQAYELGVKDIVILKETIP